MAHVLYLVACVLAQGQRYFVACIGLYTFDWSCYRQRGDSNPEKLSTATQVQGTFMPIIEAKSSVEIIKVADEMKNFKAYAKLRVERMNKQLVGVRMKKAAEAGKDRKK